MDAEPTVGKILNDAGGFIACDFCSDVITEGEGEFAVREAMCPNCQVVQLADLDDDEFRETTGWSRPCRCTCHDHHTDGGVRVADTYPDTTHSLGATPAMDYYTDTVKRCVTSVRSNDGHPLAAWSSGEKLLVALVLWDQAYLHAEGCSYATAMDQAASGIQLDRAALPGWLDQVRLAVQTELARQPSP